jgi:4-hydroxy-tetrahydrodipicolinate synthase
MTDKKIRGTGVAIITPFNEDKTIDFPALGQLVEYLIKGGIDFLVVLGTTGESATLTSDERNQVLDYVIEVNNGRLPIVAGFGGNNTQAVINSIRARGDFSRIDAILSVAPYYNKPNQRGLVEHFTAIADASPVPVILYNVPGRTKSNINAETTLKLAEHPNIMAIKEASGNFAQIMEIVRNKPDDFTVLSGDDAITLPLISIGVEGVISVVAMVYPELMSKMVRLALEGDYEQARQLHYKILPMTNAIFEDGNPAGVKAALSIKGMIKNQLRLPLVPVA